MNPLLAMASGGASPGPELASRPALLFIAIAALSILPFVLLLMTSFVKIAVVLSILRSALGAAQIPPSQITTGLALVLTIYAMAPTGERMYRAAEPAITHSPGADLMSGQGMQALVAATAKAKEPLREFLLRNGSAPERKAFHALALRMRTPEEGANITDRDFLVLLPAFLAAELRRAFEIGFLVFIPFLVIDLVVANLLLALGMNMVSPTAVSLPFKLLLFVIADGWQILMRGLVQGYV